MRSLLCLLLLACAAHAGEVLVRVTFDNDPVEGAGVAVVKQDAEIVFAPLAFQPAARTDAAGEAVVDVPEGGRVVVAMAGYALAVAPVERETVDVALRPERIFTGRVFDKDGKPVIGAQVKLRTTFNLDATFPAKTDAEGRFAMLGLWLDNYVLEIEADGFLAYESAELTEKDSGAQHVLSRPASLSGLALDGDGKPVADLRVGHRWGKAVRTDAEGRFVFEGLIPGRPYRPRALPPYRGRTLEVVLQDGETRTDVTLPVQRPARLRWRTVDADGKPVPGVTARGARLRKLEFELDDEGRQVVEIVPAEGGELFLEAEGFERLMVPFEATGPGGVRDLGDVVLARTAMVEVGVRLPGGTPALAGKIDDQPLKDGAATVPQGRYTVRVPGFVPEDVDVQPPGPVIVTLPEPRWLTGIALSPEGAPVANVVVTSSILAEAKTDEEGRFRLGPLRDVPTVIHARRPPWEEVEMPVAMGDGDLVLRFTEASARLLRGRVLDGERPVRRFLVNNWPFVDEDGRFETTVTGDTTVWIEVDDRPFPFAMPPEDRELIARLPSGSARVTLEGGAVGHEVRLLTLTRTVFATATTDDEGIARFDRLPTGVCLAAADGYADAEVDVVEGEPPLVVLVPRTLGVLRVRCRDGSEVTEWAAGPDAIARVRAGDTVVEARVPDGELLVDLASQDAGTLVLLGGEALDFVEGTIGPARITCFPTGPVSLPPGRYTVTSGVVRRRITLAAGETLEVDLAPGPYAIAGRVLRPDGTPAHGATVSLVDIPHPDVPVDPAGGFRVDGLPAGVYECTARLGDWRSAVGRVTLGPDGVTADGLPLVVRPPRGDRFRLVGPGASPLLGARIRVDGRWVSSDEFGRVPLPGPEATLDLDLPGLASVRGLRVRDGQTVELARGASLVVLLGDVARERVEVRVGGRPWAPLERDPIPRPEAPGQLRLDDLPAEVVEVEILVDPATAPVPEEEAESPPPGPEITRVRLRPGMVTTVDLRD